ncbi:rhamnogalacturonan acetylesterase [Sediminibacterium roseum]|uniref:Rhamnogalacturonan acetylesterase n=1 Tax=Sediminibacterium roseum TaxID=1978412 RepID=A0ABW9ZWU7_9BACT|nr:rhamnogalacturonan acetylesterase [Sediminibacterium roseum]NCI51632.1 rhamnogalacturonan acetylesterase [Sediminibacterium roseum]
MKHIRPLVATTLLIVFCSFLTPPKKIKVWMIGDSTMCVYGPERSPLTGWGMPFAMFFDSTVTVDNRARGGRSTRTFISENRWQPVADSLQEGDYLLIQFGHNDEAKEEKYKDRYTTPEDYRRNLVRFIAGARNKKAFPVLITPVSRMRFDKDGKALETHVEYSAIVMEVAKEQNVPVIDLDRKSRELMQKLGPDASRLLFMQLEPGEHPFYPEGSKDNTHFNELGARKMAEIVLAEIRAQRLELADRVVVRTAAK